MPWVNFFSDLDLEQNRLVSDSDWIKAGHKMEKEKESYRTMRMLQKLNVSKNNISALLLETCQKHKKSGECFEIKDLK